MNTEEFNISAKNKRVLVAPLAWGLGHTTRCIPLIKELQKSGCEVIIAANTTSKSLLQQEFKEIVFIDTPDFEIKYSKSKYWFVLILLLQVPKIIRSIIKEHSWLKKTVADYHINLIISDNRYGLFHATVPAVFITHQLAIKTGNFLTDWMVKKINYYFINRYKYCWVPDFEGTTNLAGDLSHPEKRPPNVVYLGALSRFEKKAEVEKGISLLIICTGPEPQRTIFEKLLLSQLSVYKGSVVFVRGIPGAAEALINKQSNIKITNHLSASELNTAIQQADIVISRTGYTTVMDLVKLQQKAILIPTPGQTEQEYLAKHLMEQQLFYCMPQHEFDLTEALKQSATGFNKIASFDMDRYKTVIQQLVQSLST